MGKQKAQIRRPKASRQMIVATLAKAAHTNKLLMEKVDYLRTLLRDTNQEHCGACGAVEGKHLADCILTDELAKLTKPGEAAQGEAAAEVPVDSAVDPDPTVEVAS